ncbi:GntR family transcriptional regulator [Gordonia sp. ABSL1-1]|uniref:GntR family transcriptional regulator n=1 Tax=Gordonia sp. ABSL1-1 TaxID=3053923 RepID=UPI0025725C82|nr:GntR family transcriptional regulator [Gordonia sp. ABSL1-1]MDL9938649.1 GntR family transcriptional regulator [Gordonia sp. ABSL1-1]
MTDTIGFTSTPPAPVRLGRRGDSTLLTDQVFHALHERIATGEWAPGKPLRIREVATLVGTSEMPVREAFRRLEQAGLIHIEPYRGATVRQLSIEELEHTYDVRILLEPAAARAGGEYADDRVVDAMRGQLDRLQQASARGDVAAAVAEDEQLLTTLYTAGPNQLLTTMVRGLWDSCRPYKNIWAANAAERGVSTWSHLTDLIDAAERNDGVAAAGILDRTYRSARSTVRELLDPSTESKS